MATYSVATTASLFGNGGAKLPNLSPNNRVFSFSPLPSKPKLPSLSLGLQPVCHCSTLVRAQVNEDAPDGSSNASTSSQTKSQVTSATSAMATEESISEFISQVSSLVKLVDSRDIVELRLKQLDCELLIRKKEALPWPPTPPSAPASVMHAPPPPLIMPAAAPPPSQTAAPAPSAPTSSPTPAAKSMKSSLPPLKCPMAGTLYRSPAPGEPPFVKVGDKVQKGQVLCIIEAMKLMNEIEADQSGTIVEILVEDGKLVSVDMPLFVIEPE